MNTTNRLWHVGVAVGLALLAVLLTTFYVTNYKRHVQRGESQVTVLVAAKDIPVDTQGSDLTSGAWLNEETVARRQVVPGAISDPSQLKGLIATEETFTGEQVTTRRFGTPAERGVRAQIKGTQRTFQLSGNADQVLAGTLRDGDHVDVVGTWQLDGAQIAVSRVIVRDALVLTAPPTPSKAGALTSSTTYAAQLRLTDAESQKVEWLLGNGKDWRLEIRPPADAAASPRWHDNAETLLKDGAGER